MDLLPLLDELRIHARNGLRYADDPYDEYRYGRILDLVAECYGETLDLPSAEARDRLAADLGYATPNVGSEAAVFDDEGARAAPEASRRRDLVSPRRVHRSGRVAFRDGRPGDARGDRT